VITDQIVSSLQRYTLLYIAFSVGLPPLAICSGVAGGGAGRTFWGVALC